MKIAKKLFENLSAYLDGELSPEERFEIEELLRTSAQAQEELRKIKLLKETVQNFKTLPADEYFESRLLPKLKSGYSFYHRFSVPRPAILFAGATLLLMLVLRTNLSFFESWFSQGRSDLEALYSKNLTSLLMAADLTNEDLFDFAFNKNLPLDASGNKVLSIGTDENGKEFLEVKYASSAESNLKLNDFVRQFNLNREQKGKVDSILESYSGKLAKVVLVNDKNTIAVNPELWRYHSQLRHDLLAYASSVNREAALTAFGSETDFNDLIHEPDPAPLAPVPAENYYFITPDSIFYTKVKVDENRIQSDIVRLRSKSKNNVTENKIKIDLTPVFSSPGEPRISGTMRVMVNDKSIKVIIPEEISPLERNRELENLTVKLDSAFSQLKRHNLLTKFEVPPAAGSEFRVSVKTDSRTGRSSISYGYDAPDMVIIKKDSTRKARPADSVFISRKQRHFQYVDSSSIQQMLRMADSLAKKFGSDSQWFFNQPDIDNYFPDNFADSSRAHKDQLREEIRREWLQFRKEMNRLREEMQKFREELKPEKKKKQSEPVEIRFDLET